MCRYFMLVSTKEGPTIIQRRPYVLITSSVRALSAVDGKGVFLLGIRGNRVLNFEYSFG